MTACVETFQMTLVAYCLYDFRLQHCISSNCGKNLILTKYEGPTMYAHYMFNLTIPLQSRTVPRANRDSSFMIRFLKASHVSVNNKNEDDKPWDCVWRLWSWFRHSTETTVRPGTMHRTHVAFPFRQNSHFSNRQMDSMAANTTCSLFFYSSWFKWISAPVNGCISYLELHTVCHCTKVDHLN